MGRAGREVSRRSAKHEAGSGDRHSDDNDCGSRGSRDLPPLQGSAILNIHLLGLTPQAKCLSPLRGLAEWRPVPPCGLTPQAKCLSPLRGLMDGALSLSWGD